MPYVSFYFDLPLLLGQGAPSLLSKAFKRGSSSVLSHWISLSMCNRRLNLTSPRGQNFGCQRLITKPQLDALMLCVNLSYARGPLTVDSWNLEPTTVSIQILPVSWCWRAYATIIDTLQHIAVGGHNWLNLQGSHACRCGEIQQVLSSPPKVIKKCRTYTLDYATFNALLVSAFD